MCELFDGTERPLTDHDFPPQRRDARLMRDRAGEAPELRNDFGRFSSASASALVGPAIRLKARARPSTPLGGGTPRASRASYPGLATEKGRLGPQATGDCPPNREPPEHCRDIGEASLSNLSTWRLRGHFVRKVNGASDDTPTPLARLVMASARFPVTTGRARMLIAELTGRTDVADGPACS